MACERPPRLEPEPWLACAGLAAFAAPVAVAAELLAGVDAAGTLVDADGEEPELLLVECPCSANSHTPANRSTATSAI